MADILTDLGKDSKTGTLEIKVGSIIKNIFLKNGDITFAASTSEEDDLGKYLLKKGKVSSEEFDQISYLTKKKNQKIGKIIIDRGYLKPNELFQEAQHQIEDIIISLLSKKEGGYEFKEGELPSDQPITLQISTADIINRGTSRSEDAAAAAPPVEKILDEPATHMEPAGDIEQPQSGKPDRIEMPEDIVSAAQSINLDDDSPSTVLDIGGGEGSKEEPSSGLPDFSDAATHMEPAGDIEQPQPGKPDRIEIPEDIVSAAQDITSDDDSTSPVLDISEGAPEDSKDEPSSSLSDFSDSAPHMDPTADIEQPQAGKSDRIEMPEDIVSAAQSITLEDDSPSPVLDIGEGEGSKEEPSSGLPDFSDAATHMEPAGDIEQPQPGNPDRIEMPEETESVSQIPVLNDDSPSPVLDIGSGAGEDSKEEPSSGLSDFSDAATHMEPAGDIEQTQAGKPDHIEMPEDIPSAPETDITPTEDRDEAIEQEPVSTQNKDIEETTEGVELDTVRAFADEVFTPKKTLSKRLRFYAVAMLLFALLLGGIVPFVYDIENIKLTDIEAKIKNIRPSDIESTIENINIKDIKSATKKLKNKFKGFLIFSSAPAEKKRISLPPFRDKALAGTVPGMSENTTPLPFFHEEALSKLLRE